MLTRDDYERYGASHPHMNGRLAASLVERHFLFLGFGFRDPHLIDVFGRVRTLQGDMRASHQLVLLRGASEGRDEARRRELFSRDLERYGIHVLAVDDSSGVLEFIEAVGRQLFSHNVFLSGSDDSGECASLAAAIGQQLMTGDFTLVTGAAQGVGRIAYNAAAAWLAEHGMVNQRHRLQVHSLPKGGGHVVELVTDIRVSLIERCRFCIVMRGREGTLEEAQLALQKEKVVLPLYWTGGTASQIWPTCRQRLSQRAVRQLRRCAALKSPVEQAEEVVKLIRSLTIA